MNSVAGTQTNQRTQPAKGRRTICDRCTAVQDDCLWIRRESDPRTERNELVLCALCRREWKSRGVVLVNVDQDFQQVAV